MYNLSLTSSQPQIKQDLDGKASIKNVHMINETANNYETTTTPDCIDYFQHGFSNHYQSSRFNQEGNYFDAY